MTFSQAVKKSILIFFVGALPSLAFAGTCDSGSIYVSTSDRRLWKIRISTLQAEEVMPLPDVLLDIAFDSSGSLLGIGGNYFYSIDVENRQATLLGKLGASAATNAMSIDDSGQILLASATGSYWRSPDLAGLLKPVFVNQLGVISSGDIASSRRYGTYLTAYPTGVEDRSDILYSLDERSGAISRVGATGFQSVWGLDYVCSNLYGATSAGEFFSLDLPSGKGSLLKKFNFTVYGAAGCPLDCP